MSVGAVVQRQHLGQGEVQEGSDEDLGACHVAPEEGVAKRGHPVEVVIRRVVHGVPPPKEDVGRSHPRVLKKRGKVAPPAPQALEGRPGAVHLPLPRVQHCLAGRPVWVLDLNVAGSIQGQE